MGGEGGVGGSETVKSLNMNIKCLDDNILNTLSRGEPGGGGGGGGRGGLAGWFWERVSNQLMSRESVFP